MQSSDKRLLHIDAIKIISIYMVLFNHTDTDGFVFFINARDFVLYPFFMFNAIFIKIAVPLFLMSSGALLLDKEESYQLLIRKRFIKFFIVLFVGSVIQYLYKCLRVEHVSMSLTTFFKVFYTGSHIVAYWYLYAFLAYILMLPFLRKLAKTMERRDYFWMILMFSIISLMSIFEFLLWKGKASHNSYFSFFITGKIVFYPLIGYFIEKKLAYNEFTKKRMWLMIMASIISITICCLMTQYKCVLTNEWDESSCQTFFNSLIFVPAITVYYTIKMWFLHHNVGDRLGKIISTIGGTTFGIFLFENIYRKETRRVFDLLKTYIGTFPACCIWILVACMVGSLITYVIKKIPGIRHFL